uniref:RING-type domain-containing protein n=1 Tax=Mycena chlorophos TaxID=658473 RepID=A0ABQ0LUC8_MYCCL|nr:predicted protein [Mycena chlorophos]
MATLDFASFLALQNSTRRVPASHPLPPPSPDPPKLAPPSPLPARTGRELTFDAFLDAQHRRKPVEVAPAVVDLIKGNFGGVCAICLDEVMTVNPCPTCVTVALCVACMVKQIEDAIGKASDFSDPSVSCFNCRSSMDVRGGYQVTNLQYHLWARLAGVNPTTRHFQELTAPLEKARHDLVEKTLGRPRYKGRNYVSMLHMDDYIQDDDDFTP